MTTTTQSRNLLSAKKKANREILRTVPYQEGFHFYMELGKYTGITATSLDEFAAKLQIIPADSVAFHFQRGDFQKWFRNILRDEALAKRFDQLKPWSSQPPENLRKKLYITVQRRLTELRTTA